MYNWNDRFFDIPSYAETIASSGCFDNLFEGKTDYVDPEKFLETYLPEDPNQEEDYPF